MDKFDRLYFYVNFLCLIFFYFCLIFFVNNYVKVNGIIIVIIIFIINIGIDFGMIEINVGNLLILIVGVNILFNVMNIVVIVDFIIVV